MENVIHRLTLDLTGADMMPRVEVQQDNARTLVVSLTQGGRPYWIAEGVTAVFSGRKPDGNPLFNGCTIEGSRVRYDFTDQTTNVAGIVECEILLYSGDERILASPRFELAIDELIHKDGDVPESAPELSALTQMVAAGTAMLEDLREALAGLEGVEEILVQASAAAGAAGAAAEAAQEFAESARGREVGAAEQAARAETAAVLAMRAYEEAEQAYEESDRMAGRASTAADRAEAAAKRAEEAATGGNGSGQNPPQDGEDGFSPIATVTQTATGATISITDKNGTTTATVTNGKDGKDGQDGAKGEKGDTGPAGPQGEKGDTGATGPKGDTGATGPQGPAGADGEKGDKGDKGDTGATGAQGNPGKDGANGKDGVSAAHSWNGTTLTITSASGTSSADLKGAKGDKGDTGATGPKGDKGDTGAAGKDANVTMHISPDGSDSNDGLTADKPKKTVKACVNAGASRISAKRGVYREAVQLWNIGELEISPTDNELEYAVGVEREPIVFEVADSVAVSSLAAYNSIKRVAYSNASNTQFDKVFTKKSQPPVVSDYGSRYNSTIWLLSNDEKTVCIKLKPVLTVAECEAEVNTFTYVSGYIYINADLTGVEKIIVPALWETGFYINGAQKLVLKEVEVRFSGTYNIDIRNCAYFDFYKCACKYTSYASGFHPFNSNGRMTACYATKNFDGYGISGYGHTTYVDCVSEFNFDDGMSHHDGTSGTVIGGRFEGNGKGGNTPAYGAKVNIYGGLYKDNASFGIGYLWASGYNPADGMVQGAVMVGNPIGLSVGKNCNVTAMGCIYQGNTVDAENNGNLIEYNPAYVKSVNGIKPDETGNVKIEVSGGGETGPTNVLPLAINSDGTPYVGDNGEKGYRKGCRVSSSGTEKASDKNDCSGFIACKSGDVIRIKNATFETSGYSVQYFFNGSFANIPGVNVSEANITLENGVYSFTIPTSSQTVAYVRLTFGDFNENTIVTVNEEIPA